MEGKKVVIIMEAETALSEADQAKILSTYNLKKEDVCFIVDPCTSPTTLKYLAPPKLDEVIEFKNIVHDRYFETKVHKSKYHS